MMSESGALRKRVATAREVADMLNESLRSFKQRLADDPNFPKPIQISKKQPVWRIADLDEWLSTRPGITLPADSPLRKIK